MFGVVVGIQGRPAGQHSRTEPREARTRREPWLGPEWSHENKPWRDHFESVRGGRPDFGSVRGGRPSGRGKTRRRPRKTRGQKNRRRDGWERGRDGPGQSRGVNSGCKNRGRSDTFTARLAFIRFVGQTLRDARRPIGGKFASPAPETLLTARRMNRIIVVTTPPFLVH